jgi:deazaflavin-dependent oxidoreductase (nitroreductase family)
MRIFWAVHRAVYSLTGGRLGLSPATMKKSGMLGLTTIGRRSGQARRAIIAYFEDGPNLVTLALNGGGESEPGWWLNLQAHPDTTVQLFNGPRAVHGRAATAEERPRLWARWVDYDGENLNALAARRPRKTAVVILEPRMGGL